eukprot:TRINITY_DN2856_c0_g1_i1.p1 TRINITY_DN2856_c0_g1~~TRINITY_DN2856_c0_g1_i1.p1  ORF type:complete len:295 (-),score=49.97 TRINITY_DN2856_c0_g1_i1:1114-1998(-)
MDSTHGSINKPLSLLHINSADSVQCALLLDDILPLELVLEIFSYFSVQELVPLHFVCKKWNIYADHNQLWERFFYNKFDRSCPLVTKLSWKRRYKRTTKWGWNEGSEQKIIVPIESKHTGWNTYLGSPALLGSSKLRSRYYEISVDRLISNKINTIRIAFGCIDALPEDVPYLLGYTPFGFSVKDKTSWSYRGDGVIMSRGLIDSKCATIEAGDRMGFKLNFKKKTISFFKNGEMQGKKVPISWGPKGLSPAVSVLRDSAVSVRTTSIIPKEVKLPKSNSTGRVYDSKLLIRKI